MMQRRFIDQLDAEQAALEFLDPRIKAAQAVSPQVDLRSQYHEGHGRTLVLWVDGRMRAVAVVVRDDRNRALLTAFDMPGAVPQTAARLITSLPGWPQQVASSDPPSQYDLGFRAAVELCEAALQEALKPEALARTLSRSLDQAPPPEQTAFAKQMTVYWRRLWRRATPAAAKA